MRKVKIALIGFNELSHARTIFQSVVKQTDIFELVGYALPENEREKFPDIIGQLDAYLELTLEEILNNPEIEAVVIETEELYLTKYALLAAEHKKHIHMEKPGGINRSEFEKLIEVAKVNQIVLHIGYMYRYNPFVKQLLHEIKAGELGEIVSVEAQMNCYHPAKNRQWLSAFPGGMLFFLGCHLVDLILQIQGIPTEIIPLSCATGVDGVTANDFGMAVFKYKNGVSFAKVSAVEVGGFARRQLVVAGTKKTVVLEPLEMYVPGTGGMQFTGKTEYQEADNWVDMGEKSKSEIFDRYDPMMSSFAEMVRGEKDNPYTYDYELELYKSILVACKE